MVSDAVGAKVFGKRSEGTLPSVFPIRCMESKAEIRFTGSPPDSDAAGVAHPQQKSITRPTGGSTKNACRIKQHCVVIAIRQPTYGYPRVKGKGNLRKSAGIKDPNSASSIENANRKQTVGINEKREALC